MRMSWVALETLADEEVARDPALRRLAKRTSRPRRELGRGLSDEELLQKLQTAGMPMDRERLDDLSRRHLSAEEAEKSEAKRLGNDDLLDDGWVWVALSVFWERWFPDRASFERLQDRMQAGYRLSEKDDDRGCAEAWLGAWDDFLALSDRGGIRTLREFDGRFAGTEFVFNWVQDLESHLSSAGFKEARFIEARKAICEEVLRRFAAEDDLFTQNFRRALGETIARLGNPAGADERFQEWLGADPEWGWGWIGWSDCYWLLGRESRDLQKAEDLLRKGLAVQGVRDRTDLLERLKDLCEESGKEGEAAALRKEIESLQGPRSGLECPSCGGAPSAREEDAAAWPPAVEPLRAEKKPGRNDPCPCGSGKKSKRCCG